MRTCSSDRQNQSQRVIGLYIRIASSHYRSNLYLVIAISTVFIHKMKVDPQPLGYISALKNLWPGLSEEDIFSILRKTKIIKPAVGECTFRVGSDPNQFVVVLAGSVDVCKGSATSQQPGMTAQKESEKLFTLYPGDAIGESLLSGNASIDGNLISAACGVQMMCIDITALKEIMHSSESVNATISKSLAEGPKKFRPSLGVAPCAVNAPDATITVFDFKSHETASFEAAVNRFKQDRDFDIKYLSVKLSVETAPLAAGSQIVCIFVNDVASADVLTKLHGLGVKCIALRCAGFNNVDLKAAHDLGMQVVRVPAYSPYAVAEHAAALILALNRKIVHAHSRVMQGNFSLANLVGFDLHGKTVGVIGTGKIGQCFIKIMMGFGCQILCYDLYRSTEVASWENVRYVDTIDELYQKSRIISLHCSLMPSTRYIINAESIKKMVPKVMIINTSRGPLINTKDLIEGLKTGKIGYAGLDVYEEESAYFFEDMSDKVMTDDILARLMTFNNVIITSHQAFLTNEALEAIAQTTMKNIGEIMDQKTGADLTNNVQ
ncbi:hypothetical protein QVD99_003125 [Batrachochytrium dendrobatidis]|nr:hypothetical protein QVD99_003125 [Batrachochytrium dendrobatidis]